MANEDWDRALRRIAKAQESGARHLSLRRLKIDSLPPEIAGLSEFWSIDLKWTSITDADLRHVAGLTELQHLELGSTKITDAGLTQIAGMTGLWHIDLSKTQISNAGLHQIADMTGLRHLYLNDTQITDAGLHHIAGLSGLQGLYLNGTQVKDLRPLLALPLLTEGPWGVFDAFDLDNTPALSDPAVAAAMEQKEPEDRRKALLAHLRSLPEWPKPLAAPPKPTGEPRPPALDPSLPIVATEEGLDFAPIPVQSDPITEAALEELQRIIQLLARKANQHDDLRGLTDRAAGLLDQDGPPDALRLHLVYQALRRLHAGQADRADSFDSEVIAGLDALQDCVPGITLGNEQVQVLLARQRQDREAPSPPIDRAREDAVLRVVAEPDSPVAPTLRAVAQDVLEASPEDPLGATRKVLSRNVVIAALKYAAGGGVAITGWVLSQSPEIQSLAASIGDDAYWWATRIIEKLRAGA